MLMLENPIRSDTRGTEEIGPEDTFDADYGQRLQRVYNKGVVRPAGFEPATLGLEGPVSDRLSIDGYHPRRLDGLDLANSRRFLPNFAVSSPHMR